MLCTLRRHESYSQRSCRSPAQRLQVCRGSAHTPADTRRHRRPLHQGVHVRSTFRRTAVIGVIIALLLAASGCSGGKAGDAGGAAKPAEFRVGIFGPDVTFAVFYSAIGTDGALSK